MACSNRLVLEGKISTHSGRLLIIDPCYLSNFDYDKAVNRLDEPLNLLMEKRSDQECSLLDKLIESIKEMERIVESSPEEQREILRRLDHDSKAYQTFKRRKLKRPKISPPHLLQEQLFVAFRNPIGDGFYPITQTDRRIYVVFDYPLKPVGRDGAELDESRLEGKLVGRSAVDTGIQVITDPDNFKVKSEIYPKLYSLIEVPNGSYACRFIRENLQLSIRKTSASVS